MPAARFLDPHARDEEELWRDLLARAPERTPFSSLPYARAVAEASDLNLRLLVLQEDNRLIAGVPLYEKKRGPVRTAVVPPFTPLNPFLVDPPVREGLVMEGRSSLDLLLKHIADDYHAAAFHLTHTTRDVRAFSWNGYTCRPLYTYVYEREEDRAYSRTVRKRLRSVPTEQYVVDESCPVDDAVDLIRERYSRPGQRAPISREKHRKLFARLVDDGILQLIGLRDQTDQGLAAVQALVSDGRQSFAWMAGSEKGPAMTVLMDHVISGAIASGTRLDLVGANTPSIAHFKRAFGGRLTSYYRASHIRPRWLRGLHSLRPIV